MFNKNISAEEISKYSELSDLISIDHLTIRQVCEKTGLGRGTVESRLKSMKRKHPSMYSEVQKVLDYNKRYRFKSRSFWEDFDPALL